ncbi:hypothetical protein C8A00DRAFT_38571, partial [Chaetomidium leptoderma]
MTSETPLPSTLKINPTHPTPPPNLYIVGAQSTSKTTLVNNLNTYFTTTIASSNNNPGSPPTPFLNHGVEPPTIITEVARTVLKAHHFTAQDVRTPARSLALQQLILQAQATAEKN